jgi:hypothetical protein
LLESKNGMGYCGNIAIQYFHLSTILLDLFQDLSATGFLHNFSHNNMKEVRREAMAEASKRRYLKK